MNIGFLDQSTISYIVQATTVLDSNHELIESIVERINNIEADCQKEMKN